jgi:hypothetical protein
MDPRAVKTAGSSSNVLLDGDVPSAPVPLSTAASAAPSSSVETSPGSVDAPPAAPAVVTPATLLEALKAQREWAKAITFDVSGKVLAATIQPLDGEMGCVRPRPTPPYRFLTVSLCHRTLIDRAERSPSCSTSARTRSRPASSCSTSSTTFTGGSLHLLPPYCANVRLMPPPFPPRQVPSTAHLRPAWRPGAGGWRGHRRVHGLAQGDGQAAVLPHHVCLPDAVGARRAAAEGVLRDPP